MSVSTLLELKSSLYGDLDWKRVEVFGRNLEFLPSHPHKLYCYNNFDYHRWLYYCYWWWSSLPHHTKGDCSAAFCFGNVLLYLWGGVSSSVFTSSTQTITTTTARTMMITNATDFNFSQPNYTTVSHLTSTLHLHAETYVVVVFLLYNPYHNCCSCWCWWWCC